MRSFNLNPKLWAALAFVLLAGTGAAWGLFFDFDSDAAAPRSVALPPAEPSAGAEPLMWPAPQFSLPDQDAGAVSTQSLRGKVCIVDFIFTSCASTCPKMTAQRAELLKQIDDPRVTFLSISVDPARDDQTIRKKYAADHGMDETRWRFVSPPDRAAALKIAQGMKIAGSDGHSHGGGAGAGDSTPVLHSERFVLLDAHGRIRGNYSMLDADSMQRLVRDALACAADIMATPAR